MHAVKFALLAALVALPLAASAQSPSPSPSPGPTATNQSVDPHQPQPTPDPVASHHVPPPATAAPLHLAECAFTPTVNGVTHKFAIVTYVVKPSPESGFGTVSVSAPKAIYADIEGLATQHTAISKAVFACPSRIETTVGNATIATPSGRSTDLGATFDFTLDYRPDAKNPKPHPTL